MTTATLQKFDHQLVLYCDDDKSWSESEVEPFCRICYGFAGFGVTNDHADLQRPDERWRSSSVGGAASSRICKHFGDFVWSWVGTTHRHHYTTTIIIILIISCTLAHKNN